ncbi:MAG TPA: cupin domain-containing protein [Phycicoccus sp.]|nr:cupin domain-containing protein [Phycicoccus sp.]
MRTAEQLIESFGMIPIPREGAWYAAGPRTTGLSSILVLLASTPQGFSALHRLDVDEGWQWLDGAPAALLQLRPSGGRGRGKGSLTLLDHATRQVLVPRSDWQGAATLGAWSLLACWCAPAFEEHHFTLGDGDALTREYPEYAAEIRLLSRPIPPPDGRHRR